MDPAILVLGGLQYVALLLALCVHEFSHAAAARLLGDDTAESQGRLTLSPLAHADPVGTVLLPLLGLFTAFPMFGWARPVPVQPRNFRPGWYSRGQILVAAAGPGSNVVQGLAWVAVHAALTRLAPLSSAVGTPVELLAVFVESSVLINFILAAFNLIPIPPLDGAHVASWGLPRRLAERYDALVERAGLLLFVPVLLFARYILAPPLLLGLKLLEPPFSAWRLM